MNRKQMEALLDEFGIDYEYVKDVPLSMIDLAHPVIQQVRDQLHDDDTIVAYATQMEEGADFPPETLFPTTKGRYTPVDGFQRIHARKLVHSDGGGMLPGALVVDRDAAPGVLFAVACRANRDHGLRFRMEEIVGNAISMIEAYGFTVEQAAKHVGIKKSTLEGERFARKGRERLTLAGVAARRVDKLQKGTLQPLANCGDDDAIKEAANIASEFNMKVTDVKEMCREVKALSKESDRLRKLQEKRDELSKLTKARRARGVSAHTPQASRAKAALTSLTRIDVKKAIEQTVDRKAMRTLCEAGEQILQLLLRDLR